MIQYSLQYRLVYRWDQNQQQKVCQPWYQIHIKNQLHHQYASMYDNKRKILLNTYTSLSFHSSKRSFMISGFFLPSEN